MMLLGSWKFVEGFPWRCVNGMIVIMNTDREMFYTCRASVETAKTAGTMVRSGYGGLKVFH